MDSKLVNKWCRMVYGKDLKAGKLVLKIDLLVMTYIGPTTPMPTKKDLHFHGKQYNMGNTIFLIGYTVGQIPSNIALTYIRPRYWFTAMQTCWAVICLAQYSAKNVKTVFALRFLMGLFESSTFVGTHAILGSWYTPKEIGKRSAMFVSAAQVGSILSGLIQGGLYRHMNGRNGLKGWQWLFIIDFIVSMPSIIYGFFFFPDFPHNTTCFWFSEEDKQLAKARLPNAQVHEVQWRSTATWKRIATSWHTYMFPILFTLYGTGLQITGNNVMPFFMEKHGDKKVEHLNYYPTGMTATGILAFWVYAIMSDKLRTRVPASIAIGCTFILGAALLYSKHISYGGKLTAFYLLGTCLSPQALWYSWANDLTRDHFELRIFLNGSMNTIMEAFIAWWPLVFYPADSKNFNRGFISTMVIGGLIIIVVLIIWMLERRQLAQEALAERNVLEGFGGKYDEKEAVRDEITPSKEA
ncbi:pantothenate transporter liz1 [Grosmannia clavigera kw1407]|uniref:Pantothenate transporter liz1 n=1 Tax=Grosmannia clavigera (strain kw1407 / UAMH 11150) TaxID=655863 RepID=F0XBI1_GROCL|nr:pantothenate transporter liz1 [Grosmannia clavigera kw1407]EFX05067.1 pantothenate transporter liz1 [Grosmannia clavigera kw1407]